MMTTRAAANLVRSSRIGDGRGAIADSPTVAGRGFKVACSGRRIFESDRTRGARVETQVGTFRLRVLFLHQRAFSEAPSLSKAAFPVTALHTVSRIKGMHAAKPIPLHIGIILVVFQPYPPCIIRAHPIQTSCRLPL
jgi:hypothetical protein